MVLGIPTPNEARKGKVGELIGYQEIRNHIVFDVKMDFTRKARYCAGGHTTDAPDGITYSSVVSRDSVRIGLLAAALTKKGLARRDGQQIPAPGTVNPPDMVAT